MLFPQLDAAHDWGRKPSELGICEPEEDAPLMAAYTYTRRLMSAYEQKLADQKAPKAGK